MKRGFTYILYIVAALAWGGVAAQSVDSTTTLGEITVSGSRSEGVTRLGGAENGNLIGQGELFRAACCSLGESFQTNPSVDVNYSDAATGAKQIHLLGLSGRYVQMLVEGMPMAAGPATPYALGYVPGAWLKSIAVSKGASSVKNGFQSVTGQIDVEYLKPDDEDNLAVYLFGNSMAKGEANVMGNLHLNRRLSTEVLGHFENDFAHHDMDGDLWHDMPRMRQLNVTNRWKYVNGRYMFHGGVGLLDEAREGGQTAAAGEGRYRVQVDTRRYDAYMKHALLLDAEHNTNIALLANATRHETASLFGADTLGMEMASLNAQLMLEHEFDEVWSLSTGLSLQGDDYADRLADTLGAPLKNGMTDVIPGMYAQLTYIPTYRLTAMAGLRADRSQRYGAFVTPRLHVKWIPTDALTLRASSGMGYRMPYALAEFHYLLASGRTLAVAPGLEMERALNGGVSASLSIPAGEGSLTLNAECYYTHFFEQLVLDYDSDPTAIALTNLDGRSYSRTVQLDASYSPTDEVDVTAAVRFNDVRCTYGGRLLEAPLTSRYKALLTASWRPMMALWQVDVTLQLNGPGRMPTPRVGADGRPEWDETFPAYPRLNLQVTREFRHFSVYVGGENLTGYRQPSPIVNAADPWAADFEPTMVWGPMDGVVLYGGLRFNLKRI